jgi:hypothetical protein
MGAGVFQRFPPKGKPLAEFDRVVWVLREVPCRDTKTTASTMTADPNPIYVTVKSRMLASQSPEIIRQSRSLGRYQNKALGRPFARSVHRSCQLAPRSKAQQSANRQKRKVGALRQRWIDRIGGRGGGQFVEGHVSLDEKLVKCSRIAVLNAAAGSEYRGNGMVEQRARGSASVYLLY